VSDHRRHLITAIAALVFCLGPLPTARADTPTAPVLWDGVLRNPTGQPAVGDVVAFVRPPADQLKPGDQLTELAQVRTNDAGRFVIRTLPTDAFRAAQDPSGWATVMVFAFGDHGLALAQDSVAWKPDQGVHAQSTDSAHGHWVTTPADLAAPPGEFHAAEAPPVPETERPTNLVLDGSAPATIHAMNESPPQAPAGRSCGLLRSKDMGVHPVAVGEMHLRDAWGGLFDYTSTKSTSFQTGVSYAGRGWQVGGSNSMTATSTMAQQKTIPPADREDAQLTTYRAELLFKQFTWRCNSATNMYQWEDVATLQPVDWPNGGMRESDGGDQPRCGTDNRFYATVMPGSSLMRKNGSSITLANAISVAGFAGSMTAAVTNGVRYEWTNGHPFHRAVCGSTDYLNKNTRAATSGIH
jgi:hypothetical protein